MSHDNPAKDSEPSRSAVERSRDSRSLPSIQHIALSAMAKIAAPGLVPQDWHQLYFALQMIAARQDAPRSEIALSVDWQARALAAEAKLSAPELHSFRDAIVLEAAHQRERWGAEHDEGKGPEDWMWLVAYLSTKATQANRYGDGEKYLHHIVTCAAACANWHASATGANTVMRPGVADDILGSKRASGERKERT